MTVVGAAVLHVGVGCAVNVAFSLCLAFGSIVAGNSFHATNSIWVLVVRVRVRCGGLHILHVPFGDLFRHRCVRVFGRCC